MLLLKKKPEIINSHSFQRYFPNDLRLKKKKEKRTEPYALWYNIKRSNFYVIGVPEGEQGKIICKQQESITSSQGKRPSLQSGLLRHPLEDTNEGKILNNKNKNFRKICKGIHNIMLKSRTKLS